ncbi:MAG TPA: hypothetical protein VFR84_01545 [Candidatus Angelobacter sp.]|nr:hypothetical protein [Candidatus Angelobacter sp.]
MKKKSTGLLLCVTLCVAFFFTVISHAEGAKRQPKRPPVQPEKFDVCKLLTSDEIRSVQGDGVEESKPSVQSSGGLKMSQCLFRTNAPVHSVSIAVAAPGTERPRDFWRKQFHSSAEKEERGRNAKGNKALPEQEETESRPRAIQGVGDEAYWVGGPVTGALYVLRGDTFIRLSVGGVREEAARIEKSVALAKLVLKKLQ